MKIQQAILSLLVLFTLGISVNAQKYYTKTGLTEFKASVDTFEPVEARNESTTAILNVETGDVAALLFINAFRFRVALMEEHFNENYMDSAEHPKASFKGNLSDFDFSAVTEDESTYKVVGTITIKGVEKEIETLMKMRRDGDNIIVDASFDLLPSEFDIDIPAVVREKIAETIHVTFNYELQEKK